PTTLRAMVDLPEPDSPTTPRISPARKESETPSTARLGSRLPALLKYWCSRRTSNRGGVVCCIGRASIRGADSVLPIIEPAGNAVSAAQSEVRWALLDTNGHGMGTARMETTAAGRRGVIGQRAW